MRKFFAIGSLLLSSAAVLVTPAAALDRNDYRYQTNSYSYQSRRNASAPKLAAG